jgi:hypothetical protein
VTERVPGIGRFEVTAAVYRAADGAERTKPIQLSAQISGQPGQQVLNVEASNVVNLKKFDYLHSTKTCIASQPVDVSGTKLTVKLDYNKIEELSNSRRHDMSG